MQVAWDRRRLLGTFFINCALTSHPWSCSSRSYRRCLRPFLLACHESFEWIGPVHSFIRLIQRLVWDVPSQLTMCSAWTVVQAGNHLKGTKLNTRITWSWSRTGIIVQQPQCWWSKDPSTDDGRTKDRVPVQSRIPSGLCFFPETQERNYLWFFCPVFWRLPLESRTSRAPGRA